jgi:hypothetical protein
MYDVIREEKKQGAWENRPVMKCMGVFLRELSKNASSVDEIELDGFQ